MNKLMVFQSDFGLVDGAASAMRGVSLQVSRDLELHDLTHDITPFNIWEASYRLVQTVNYWPAGTVFVSVVDPGVGSARKSVVAKLENGSCIVTPDNGTLSLVADQIGVVEIREIDETINRLKGSEDSHTFHGRDVYAYTGARLASGIISFEQVGVEFNVSEIVKLETVEPTFNEGIVTGKIDILDVRYGSLWTNINFKKFDDCGFKFGDRIFVSITYKGRTVYNNIVRYDYGFAEVNIGEAIIYVNSVVTIGLAINQGNFARAYNIKPGNQALIEFKKI